MTKKVKRVSTLHWKILTRLLLNRLMVTLPYQSWFLDSVWKAKTLKKPLKRLGLFYLFLHLKHFLIKLLSPFYLSSTHLLFSSCPSKQPANMVLSIAIFLHCNSIYKERPKTYNFPFSSSTLNMSNSEI